MVGEVSADLIKLIINYFGRGLHIYTSVCTCCTQIVAVGPEAPQEYAVGRRVCVENHFFCGHCYQCTHGEGLPSLRLLRVFCSTRDCCWAGQVKKKMQTN